MEEALAQAIEIVEIAERQANSSYRLLAYRALAQSQMMVGQLREAWASVREAERYYDPSLKKVAYRFGDDPNLTVFSFKVWVLMYLGIVEEAERIKELVSAKLLGHNHAPTFAASTVFALLLPELMYGDARVLEPMSAELVVYCDEKKLKHYRSIAAGFLACARTILKPSEENITELQGLAKVDPGSGMHAFDIIFVSQLCCSLLVAGDVAAAELNLRRLFTLVEQSHS